MSDYERYGDYNEIEEDSPSGRGPVMIILKILTAVVCIGVVGILAFRLIIFNSYPKDMKSLYFNDELTAYYNEHDGEIKVKTQELRYVYDDPELGNFFCDYLYVIEDAGQLQITVRYNVSTVTRISEELGLSLDDSDPEIFTYRLVDNYGNVQGELTDKLTDSSAMYRYAKLVFDGVEFTPNESGEYPEWIRLEIFVSNSDTGEAYSYNLIYENHADNNVFSEYVPKQDELPNK